MAPAEDSSLRLRGIETLAESHAVCRRTKPQGPAVRQTAKHGRGADNGPGSHFGRDTGTAVGGGS